MILYKSPSLDHRPTLDLSLFMIFESTYILQRCLVLQRDLKCEVCKAVIEEIDAVIKQNATIDKINETVYDLCSKLQGALQDLVNTFFVKLGQIQCM